MLFYGGSPGLCFCMETSALEGQASVVLRPQNGFLFLDGRCGGFQSEQSTTYLVILHRSQGIEMLGGLEMARHATSLKLRVPRDG